jgi:phosphoglycolate phosphatase-like HAD superfamily hydrolase
MMNKPDLKMKVSLIITDIDNTLYDWLQIWYCSFSAMLKVLVSQSEVPQSILEAEIQSVFQKHGTAEYGYVLQELPSLRKKHPHEDLAFIYDDARKAYSTARMENLRLYPGVLETLQKLKRTGCLIVGFTESMGLYTSRRIRTLGLDGVFDYIYTPPDHFIPPEIDVVSIHQHPEDHYELQNTIYRIIPKNERKPTPKILAKIIGDDGIRAGNEKTIYIGDSLLRDIAMAQEAHVTDVFAKYGTAQNTEADALLRKVNHRINDAVACLKTINEKPEITPSYVLEYSFAELLELFKFVPHRKN